MATGLLTTGGQCPIPNGSSNAAAGSRLAFHGPSASAPVLDALERIRGWQIWGTKTIFCISFFIPQKIAAGPNGCRHMCFRGNTRRGRCRTGATVRAVHAIRWHPGAGRKWPVRLQTHIFHCRVINGNLLLFKKTFLGVFA